MNILKYRQLIDTECSNQQNTQLSVKAVKLDGQNSLKMAIGCGDLKSCDYMRYKKDKILLIEISDLRQQLINLNKQTNHLIKQCKEDLDKRIKKRIIPQNIIREEAREKFLQTDLILHKLFKYIKINIDKSKIFIIAICSDSISDIIAFQYLERDLKVSLNNFVKDVKIVLAKDLEEVI